jgi:predicted nucleic acid-binding Zn ribbon protein
VDPRPISESLSVLTRQLGMPAPGQIDDVLAVWGEVAGRLATVSEPVSIRRGRLVVAAADPTAAEALRWQGAGIVERLSGRLPDVALDGVDVRVARP